MLIARLVVACLALALGVGVAASQPAPPGAPGGPPGMLAPGRGLGELPAIPPAPYGAPVRITTDTPEYCNSLAERVARAEQARPNAPQQAEELAAEGHRMCATDLIRGGLVRLRRAWQMLRSEK